MANSVRIAHVARKRRSLVTGAAALAAAAAAPALWRPARAAAGPSTVLPAVSEGPFYPAERWRLARRLDWDADLTRVAGVASPARGEHLALTLRWVDARGRPLDGYSLEIWQCDAAAQYHHARTEGQAAARDAGFQGFGAARTAADGSVALRTIRPVAYPGRTPHIHLKLLAPGGRGEWTSQLFIAGEAGNGSDFLYRQLDATQRRAVTLTLQPAHDDGLRWQAAHTLVLPA
jgi:protocatechuate 3,4-dioxygenase beta subunit